MLYLDTGIETANGHPVALPRPRGPGSPLERPEGLGSHLSAGPSRMVKAREHLFTAGDARCHVYRIESGSVCLYRVMPDGRRQVFDFACAGDYIGLGSRTEHVCNAQALEPLEVKYIAVEALTRSAKRDPRLGVMLYEAMSRELAAVQLHLFTIGQRGRAGGLFPPGAVAARRAPWGGGPYPRAAHDRSDIADFLSLTVETVSRTLSKLRAARIIDLKQSTIVSLLDIGRLERLAAGEAAVRVTRLRPAHAGDMPPTRRRTRR